MDRIKSRFLERKDLALIITVVTTFIAVIRYGEKKIDEAEASAKELAVLEFHSVDDKVVIERDQRKEDIRMINGKLDNITQMIIDMRREARATYTR